MKSNPVGRPLKFKTVKELQKAIESYFQDCDPHVTTGLHLKDVLGEDKKPTGEKELTEYQYITKQRPYTISGLALALDTTRETLLDYEERAEYSDTIKRAKMKVHNYVEERLFDSQAAGPIFNLKNNFGWVDRSEVVPVDPVDKLLGKYELKEGRGDARKGDDAVQGSSEGTA